MRLTTTQQCFQLKLRQVMAALVRNNLRVFQMVCLSMVSTWKALSGTSRCNASRSQRAKTWRHSTKISLSYTLPLKPLGIKRTTDSRKRVARNRASSLWRPTILLPSTSTRREPTSTWSSESSSGLTVANQQAKSRSRPRSTGNLRESHFSALRSEQLSTGSAVKWIWSWTPYSFCIFL